VKEELARPQRLEGLRAKDVQAGGRKRRGGREGREEGESEKCEY